MTTEPFDIGLWRLQNQRLVGEPFASAEDAVRSLVAVQSQDYGPAKWSIGRRTGLNDSDLDRAVAEGRLLRTHVLRPTWHFVLSNDIRWLLDLTAPRIRRQLAPFDRQLGIDSETIDRSFGLLSNALAGGSHLTRNAIEAHFAAAGLAATGPRLGHLLMHGEIGGLIVSGSPAGKSQTYALLDERAPNARRLTRDEALAELTLRYFTGHGPATVKDFQWWSGLTIGDIKEGLAAVGSRLERESIAGRDFWFGSPPPPPPSAPVVHLMQAYDEYIVGYSESRVPGALSSMVRPSINQVLLVDGQVAGRWRRTVRAKEIIIEIAFDRALSGAEQSVLDGEIACFGAFHGLTARMIALAGVATRIRRPETPSP